MDATEIENDEQNDQQKQPQVLTAKVREISTLASSFLSHVIKLFCP